VANDIKVTLRVSDDGSLTMVSKNADKASDSLKKTGESARTADRRLKGTAQASANGTKNFSKMAQGITGGLVPAYATLAANVFAVSAAFNFFKRAADIKILEQTQVSFAATTGVALQTVTSGLREASGGMLTFQEAASAAAIGVAKGFSPKQMEDLAVGARKAAAALGRDFTDAFDRLVRGASKAEPELLDELGITLRLADATERYGQMIGKSAKELTASQRSQAVLLETQRQLNDLYGEGITPSNPFIQLSVTFDDLVKKGTQFLLPLFEGLANIVNRSALAAISVFGMFGVSILKAMLPLDALKEKIQSIGLNSDHAIALAMNDQHDYQKELEITTKALEEMATASVQQSAKGALGAGAGADSKLLQKAAKGNLTDPKQIGQLKSILKKAEDEYDRHGEIKTGMFKEHDIKIVQSLKASLAKQDQAQGTFFNRQKVRGKKWFLSAKVHYSKLRAIGPATFKKIGQAAEWAGKKINTAMKFAGVLGIIKIVYEAVKAVAQSPFTIIKGTLDAVSGVLNFIGPAIGKSILVPIGNVFDWIWDKFKALINGLLAAYNKVAAFFGAEGIEPLERGTSSFATAMQEMSKGTLDLGAAFAATDFGKSTLAFENDMDRMKEGNRVMESITERNTKMNEDLQNTIQGLTNPVKKQTEAQNGMTRATSLSTLGISDQIKAINRKTKYLDKDGKVVEAYVLNEVQRVQATMDLKNQLRDLAIISPLAAAALAKVGTEGTVELEALEVASRDAGATYKAMKDEITAANAAIQEGNLKTAETRIASMRAEMLASEAAFTALGETAAAKKVRDEYNAALGIANLTTEEYYNKLVKLREAQEAHTLAVAQEWLISGKLGELRKSQNAYTDIALQLQAVELQLKKEGINPELQRELELRQKLLGIKLAEADVDIVRQTQGEFSADAMQTGKLAGSAAQVFKDEGTAKEKIGAVADFANPMLERLKSLSPEGEAVGTAIQGAMAMGEAWATAFEKMGAVGATTGDKIQAGLGAAASTINALQGMMAAKSKAAVAGVDKEIAAEKARDGKSKESLAKIAAMERKKDSIKRKAFEQDKKMKMAGIVIATAQAAMQAAAAPPGLPWTAPFVAMAIAMGAAQLAAVSSTSYQGGASTASAGAGEPTSIGIGKRKSSIDLAKSQGASGELSYLRGAQGLGGAENFRPTNAFTGAKYRASGGNTAYMVGEQGPELFVPDRSGQIMPADETAAGGQSMNVNFSINAVDASGIEDLLVGQRGNIIGMLREAANSTGDLFMEQVDTGQYTPSSGGVRKY